MGSRSAPIGNPPSCYFRHIIGWMEIKAAVGLIIGGVLAAPIGAYLVSWLPVRPLMIAVGIVIIASSATRLLG